MYKEEIIPYTYFFVLTLPKLTKKCRFVLMVLYKLHIFVIMDVSKGTVVGGE